MLLLRIVGLAVASMFWPLLLVIVVIALQSARPLRVLLSFYLGGFLTATAVGMLLVFGLETSQLMTGSVLPSAPWFDATLGLLAIGVAIGCRNAHRRRGRRGSPDASVKRSRSKELIQRLVRRGGPIVVLAGVIACIVPSPLVILAMADIAQLGYSTPTTLIVIVVFFLITFAFIEVPSGAFVLAPDATRRASLSVTAWLDRNLLVLAAWALAIAGASQLALGLAHIVR